MSFEENVFFCFVFFNHKDVLLFFHYWALITKFACPSLFLLFSPSPSLSPNMYVRMHAHTFILTYINWRNGL